MANKKPVTPGNHDFCDFLEVQDYFVAPSLLRSNRAPIFTVPQHWQSLGNVESLESLESLVIQDLFILYISKNQILTAHTVKYYLQSPSHSKESKIKLKQKLHYLNIGTFFAAYPELKVQYNLLG